jgi:hypothetical protein
MEYSQQSAMATGALVECIHPKKIIHNVDADRYVFEETFGGKHMRIWSFLFWLPVRAIKYFYRALKKISLINNQK